MCVEIFCCLHFAVICINKHSNPRPLASSLATPPPSAPVGSANRISSYVSCNLPAVIEFAIHVATRRVQLERLEKL